MPSGHVPASEGSTHAGPAAPASNGGVPTTAATQISFAAHDAHVGAASVEASVEEASSVDPASGSATQPQLETL
jgi:hypothetical protein